ncbi:VWA domain-containing protein [Oceanobacter mangrovi]|uniref:VWA domain-containing protein n=1 Tax=Oceanobacter mangrovi TaxID=2862510 RepID=UPI001C8D413D|nr:VWA domain-containing protein [Oceanobacter mangrovi]
MASALTPPKHPLAVWAMLLALVSAPLLLVSCGSGDNCVTTCSTDSDDDSDDDDDDSDDSDSDDDEETETGVSYYPLAIYETANDNYNALDESAFIRDTSYPYIFNHMIIPVDSQTLESITTATLDDYLVTVDDSEIDAEESFPILQQVLGYSINLNTALVIDTSSSMDDVDQSALLAEVESFISTAQGSTNTTIANQQFSIWAFADATHITCLTSDFTSDTDTLDTALETLASNWANNAYGRSSAVYQAIVAAIGTYAGDGSYSDSTGYDYSSDDCPDLYDETELDSMTLSNIVLISSGSNTVGGFDIDAVDTALGWQSQLIYDTDSDDYASDYQGKPLLYVELEGDGDSSLEDYAETILTPTYSSSSYSFASDLLSAQASALESRTHGADNIWAYRYAFLPRDGEHSNTFESQTSYYDFDLSGTTDLTDGSAAAIGTPEEELETLVEITGANDEYLANGIASLSEITTLYPATRWTNTSYDTDSYSWTVEGVSRSANSDGSIDISSADVGLTVMLSNNSLGQNITLTVTE